METPVAATSADLPGLQALLEQCALPAADLDARHLEDFFVVRRGDAIVGSVGLERLGAIALLRSLAVAPDHQGGGLGHRLWETARARAAARGVQRLFLLTTTAEALFARWGFRRVPREQVDEAIRTTTEFTTLCPDTAVVMSLDLTDAT